MGLPGCFFHFLKRSDLSQILPEPGIHVLADFLRNPISTLKRLVTIDDSNCIDNVYTTDYYKIVKFEWDETKNRTNYRKHKVWF